MEGTGGQRKQCLPTESVVGRGNGVGGKEQIVSRGSVEGTVFSKLKWVPATLILILSMSDDTLVTIVDGARAEAVTARKCADGC